MSKWLWIQLKILSKDQGVILWEIRLKLLQQGWGLLRQFPPFRYFPNFSALLEHTLDIEYCVYIWQVSPQLSYGDTCQIWMWFKESNSYFCKIENFAYGEINERSFSNPHPSPNCCEGLTETPKCDTLMFTLLSDNTNRWPKIRLAAAHMEWFCCMFPRSPMPNISIINMWGILIA